MKDSNIYKRVEELERRATESEKLAERRHQMVLISLDQTMSSLLTLIETEIEKMP